MFYDQGCVGRVELGAMPEDVAQRLARVAGEWLEFDPPSGCIVVRHVEPTSTRPLPSIACELVRIFSEVPAELHEDIPGGDLFVHTEAEHGQLVRLRVDPGGVIHIQWAHPDFRRALRRPYMGGTEVKIDPEVQRLDGSVSFRSPTPEKAVLALQDLADTFEGLYPEGHCVARAAGGASVELTMKEVNLDSVRLIEMLQSLAEPRSLSGQFELSAFGTVLPESRLRFVFDDGKLWVQHPLLWSDKGG
jgi:hypothetical protein